MDAVAIGVVFAPNLISITALVMDLISVGVVFVDGFVAHRDIIPLYWGLVKGFLLLKGVEFSLPQKLQFRCFLGFQEGGFLVGIQL
jgi:hypothetical protein